MRPFLPSDLESAPLINAHRMGADFGNTMVLVPHPDDESLGCGGLIAMLRIRATPVTLIFVTDGSASHTSLTHPPDKLGALREKEALEACSVLGVEREDVHFLREKDSGLDGYTPSRIHSLVERIAEIFNQCACRTLVVPWRRDPHPDHRMVYRLGERMSSTVSRKPRLMEYPIWLYVNGKHEDWPYHEESTVVQLDISNVIDRKLSAIQSHRSQMGGLILDDPNGFELSEVQLAPFRQSREFYFVSKLEGTTSLPRGYFDRLYTAQVDPWNFKESPYELRKYRKSLEALGSSFFGNGLEIGCSIGVQTRMLAELCADLKAVDISGKAIDSAVEYCSGCNNIEFLVDDVTVRFPKGTYDLITCCEIGYYLTRNDLEDLFTNMYENLSAIGKMLLVHWTPYVPDYPLTGDAVHHLFEGFAAGKDDLMETANHREKNYRLQVWSKVGSSKVK
ncbi:MAG: PIG-L family deacetylase [Psychroserpens sp.]|uniref:PIG-L family deacetylase n=1 Tax=Psychroserpens sp. TaxID=2020870 RepID=UPI003C950DD2